MAGLVPAIHDREARSPHAGSWFKLGRCEAARAAHPCVARRAVKVAARAATWLRISGTAVTSQE